MTWRWQLLNFFSFWLIDWLKYPFLKCICMHVYLRVLDLSGMFVAMNLDSFARSLYKPHSANHTYESTVKQNYFNLFYFTHWSLKAKHLWTEHIYTCTRNCISWAHVYNVFSRLVSENCKRMYVCDTWGYFCVKPQHTGYCTPIKTSEKQKAGGYVCLCAFVKVLQVMWPT